MATHAMRPGKHASEERELNEQFGATPEERASINHSAFNGRQVKKFASPDFRVKNPPKHLFGTVSAVILIAAGFFGFLGVPFLGAIHLIHIDAFILVSSAVIGLFFMVLGSFILGRSSAKTPIPPDRAGQIDKDLKKQKDAKESRKLDVSNTMDRLGLETDKPEASDPEVAKDLKKRQEDKRKTLDLLKTMAQSRTEPSQD